MGKAKRKSKNLKPINGDDKSTKEAPVVEKGRFSCPEATKGLDEIIQEELSEVFPIKTKVKRDQQFWKLTKDERKAKDRAKPARKAHLVCDFSAGMKKCMRDVNNGRMECLFFDPDQLPKGEIFGPLLSFCGNVAEVKGLSEACKKAFGFQTTMLGIKKEIKHREELSKIMAVVEKIAKVRGSKPQVKCLSESKPIEVMTEPEKAQLKSSLLKRKDKSYRVFHPRPSREKLPTNDFGQDFLRFNT